MIPFEYGTTKVNVYHIFLKPKVTSLIVLFRTNKDTNQLRYSVYNNETK